jgi:hypothetical protein
LTSPVGVRIAVGNVHGVVVMREVEGEGQAVARAFVLLVVLVVPGEGTEYKKCFWDSFFFFLQ